jgi:hypothetical protein
MVHTLTSYTTGQSSNFGSTPDIVTGFRGFSRLLQANSGIINYTTARSSTLFHTLLTVILLSDGI